MSTTATSTPSFWTSLLTDIENIGSTVAKWVQSFMTSATGTTITQTLATAAGTAGGYELINNVTSTSKTAVAQDVLNIATVAQGLLSSSTPPTLTQMQTVFTGLKSDESTQLFIPLAQAGATTIASFLGTNDGGETGSGKWQPVLQAFLNGMVIAAEAFGAAAPVAAPATSTPAAS